MPSTPETAPTPGTTNPNTGAATADPRAPVSLPPALEGERRTLGGKAGPLCYYHDAPRGNAQSPIPLLLIHSVNAAGSAYEVKPVYDHYTPQRPVYALELPGFGGSDRSDRDYTPRLMTDAVHAMVEEIHRHHGDGPIDALALSLGSEFLARAARENPEAFRTLALVSPTGFSGTRRLDGTEESTRGMPWLHALLARGPWNRALFNALTRRGVIRHFLNKAFGSRSIDLGLLEYSVATTRQPGAQHAPYHFLAGNLFSRDITTVYESLPMPVFMCHGERGDFVDFRGKNAIEGKDNWQVHEMPTGALPYFERPEGFMDLYDAFLKQG